MQIIQRQTANLHNIFDAVDWLYAYTSEKQHNDGLFQEQFDKSFQSLVDIINYYGDCDFNPSYYDAHYEPIDVPHNDNAVILAFSGGKDSIASALKYKEQGKDVYLYHMKHINPALSDEWKACVECAELLGLPLYQDDVRLCGGNHMWMEHPMKNMIIASGALQYGIREGIGTQVAFGNYTTSLLDDNVFERCAGDCVDMWWYYEEIIQRIIPNFKVLTNLRNMGETLDIVAHHKDLMDANISCLCRHSLRSYRHQWVKDKYGVELPTHRCGSCYKCCVEYVYMADHDLIELSADYYKYCLSQLLRVTQAEENDATDILTLWGTYFEYPIEQSKLYDDLVRAKFTKRSIKWE